MDEIKKIIKKNQKLYKTVLNLSLYLTAFYYKFFLTIFSIFRINEKKVMIISYYGKGYGDSGKYISNELMKDSNFLIYWAGKKDNKSSIPKEVNYVKYNSIIFLYHLATSKYWINNTRFRFGIKKRRNQIYIQVWHGGLALKKIEYDVYDNLPYVYQKAMKNDDKLVDIMVSNSKFCSEMYKNAFKFNGKILEIGTPRNDILLKKSLKLCNQMRKQYGLNKNDKILLYAPTFRNSYDYNPYDVNFCDIKKVLDTQTNSNWKIFIRLHPNLRNSKLIKYSSDCIDVTNYPDIQELILASNLLVTDYSSTMFEALIANKPVILYATDIEKYKKSRGYYFEFEKLPFLIAQNNSELIKILENNNIEQLKKEYSSFKKSVGLNETGNSCKEIVKFMKKGEKI